MDCPPKLPPSLRGAKRRSNPDLLRGETDCFASLAMTAVNTECNHQLHGDIERSIYVTNAYIHEAVMVGKGHASPRQISRCQTAPRFPRSHAKALSSRRS